MMRRLLPFVVLLGGFAAAALLIITGPEVQPRAAQIVAPLVRVVQVEPKTQQFSVRTHGSVVPRTESELIPEVDGRVVEVSPALVSGGFFSKDEVLLRIDPLDYDLALEQARAGLARARSDLANARKNHRRQEDLIVRGAISDAQRDDALNRVTIAQATLREADARLARTRRDRARTEVIAPYDGRVRTERVDVGQFVKRGTSIGTIYAVDYAEVRLPIHDQELAYLDLPLTGATLNEPAAVTLSAQFGGGSHAWAGEVVRTEGELDPTTRMVHVVARIPNPYAAAGDRAPLAVGLFVDAEIHGDTLANVTALPRSALRGDDQVLIVDEGNQLRLRAVEVLRIADDEVYIGKGLQAGERVCISPLQATTDGMTVRVVDEPTSATATASATAEEPLS
ncbi:MAG: efflux RND transporter periplasmic adaptor subunit [Pseudomonadota bacterium]